MTMAVCVKCGVIKHGALVPCPRCKFFPENAKDGANAMVLSDHYMTSKELKQVSKQIKSGNALMYTKEMQDIAETYRKFFEQNPQQLSSLTPKKGDAIFAWLFLVGLIMLWLRHCVFN